MIGMEKRFVGIGKAWKTPASVAPVLLISIIFLVFMQLGTPVAGYPAEGWTAYNDLCDDDNTGSTGNVTNYGGEVGPNWGYLVKYADNTSTGAFFNFTNLAALEEYTPAVNANPLPGTDAYNEFSNASGLILDLQGITWEDLDFDLVITGLTSSRKYTIVVYGHRNGGSTYRTRYCNYTITGADSFVANASAGADTLTTYIADDTVNFTCGDNDAGYVAKWKNIVPTTDNISIEITGNNKRYVNGFKLVMEEDTTPPSVSFGGLTTPSGTQNEDYVFVEANAIDTTSHVSTFIDFDSSLVGWWRMNLGEPLGNCNPDSSTNEDCQCDELFDISTIGWWNLIGFICADGNSHAYVERDSSCDAFTAPGTDGHCAIYQGPLSSPDTYICPSYERMGRLVTNADCTCQGSGCSNPDYEPIFNFNNEFFAGQVGIIDYSKNGNTGIAQGNATQTDNGYMGKAFEFGGGGDYINISDSGDFDIDTGLTMSAWIRPNEYNGVFLDHAHDYRLYILNTGLIRFRTYNETNNYDNCDMTETLDIDTWYHVAATYNGSVKKVYINGVENVSCGFSGNLRKSDAAFFIGHRSAAPGAAFNGTIDDVILFNRSLSAAEIAALYANQSSQYVSHNFTGLANGSYPFTAYAQDAAGNMDSAERTVIITGETCTGNGFTCCDECFPGTSQSAYNDTCIGAQVCCGSCAIDMPPPNFFFHGLIDNLAIYNRALTPEEIKSHYEFPQQFMFQPVEILLTLGYVY